MTECRVVFSDFGKLTERASAEGERLVGETAAAIEAQVKARWSQTHLPIRVKGKPTKKYVLAGSRRRFYALFLEYGTVFQRPRPAMVPSAERAKVRFFAEARRLERKMR